jgi:hypothetical protein
LALRFGQWPLGEHPTAAQLMAITEALPAVKTGQAAQGGPHSGVPRRANRARLEALQTQSQTQPAKSSPHPGAPILGAPQRSAG